MKAPKIVAWGLSGALAASAFVALAGAPAQAYTGEREMNCRLYFGDQGEGIVVTPFTDEYTLTQTPAQPGVGQTVTLTLSAAQGPQNGPVPVGAMGQDIRATIDLSGAQSGTVQLVSPTAYPANPAAPNARMGAWTASGTYTATAAGNVDAALKLLKFDDRLLTSEGGSGSNADIYCADTADADFRATGGTVSTVIKQSIAQKTWGAQIATSTAQADGAQYIARSSALFSRTVTLTGSGFNADESGATLEFCDADGGNCATHAAVTNTLVTNGSGALSGNIVIPGTVALTTGKRTIKITGLSDDPALVSVTVLAAASTTLSPTQGVRNTEVTVTGSNFNVGQPGKIYTSKGETSTAGTWNTTDPLVDFTAGADGTFVQKITVKDIETKSILAVQGYPIAGPPNATQASAFTLWTLEADTVAPTGTATVSPKAGGLGLTSKVTFANIADNAGVAYVTKTVTWGDGTTSQVAAGVNSAAHKYNKLGSFPVKVVFTDESGNASAAVAAGTVVLKDSTKPTVSLTTPKKATKAKSWTTIKGKITDAGGSGAASVTVQLIEKRGGKWYAFTGKKWVKVASQKKALAKAKKLTDKTVSTGAWSVSAKKAAKGTLYVYFSGADKAGNKSAVKSKKQTIKS